MQLHYWGILAAIKQHHELHKYNNQLSGPFFYGDDVMKYDNRHSQLIFGLVSHYLSMTQWALPHSSLSWICEDSGCAEQRNSFSPPVPGRVFLCRWVRREGWRPRRWQQGRTRHLISAEETLQESAWRLGCHGSSYTQPVLADSPPAMW